MFDVVEVDLVHIKASPADRLKEGCESVLALADAREQMEASPPSSDDVLPFAG
jgi:hypothetical protein